LRFQIAVEFSLEIVESSNFVTSPHF